MGWSESYWEDVEADWARFMAESPTAGSQDDPPEGEEEPASDRQADSPSCQEPGSAD